MSSALSFGSSKKTTSQSGQVDPWDETIPYLKTFLSQLGGASSGTPGPTDAQSTAFDQLSGIASAGNPYIGDIDSLTRDLFATQSSAGTVTDGYADLQRRLGATADGQNLNNITNDPQLQQMLQMVGDDVSSRINSQFAGAGRDMSGINQMSIGKGVTSAQLPILVDQLNKEKARTDAAARDLYGASVTTSGATDAADKNAATLRALGIDTGNAAQAARVEGPNAILALEEQKKKLPYEELSWLAELLFGAAGLGQQSEGTATQKGTSFGGTLGLKL